jgi:hypothetical protein
VQHVPGEVEREGLFESDDRAEISAGARGHELLERLVHAFTYAAWCFA